MSVAELEATEIALEAPSGLWRDAWQRLKRNPGAIVGFLFVLMFVVCAIFARLLRGSVLAQKENDFVLAARSTGVPRRKILASHILPNSISPVIVQGTLALATAIIEVAGLSFLGLGDQNPARPEWGAMLTETNQYLQVAPWLAIIPGCAIVVSALGFNLIGDALREALDPKLRGRT